MIGTSTGGYVFLHSWINRHDLALTLLCRLIATMLSRFRMSVAECIQQYQVVGEKIFENRRKLSVLGYPRDKHSKRPLINAIKKLTRERSPNPGIDEDKLPAEFRLFPAPPDLCRT